MIDTHTHLYLDEFKPSTADAVNRAIEAGVEHMIFPNIDVSTIAPMKELQAQFPSRVSLAMGLHPSEVKDDWMQQLATLRKELDSDFPYVAIGEIGVDLYWDKSMRLEQLQAFYQQLLWAAELDLPVIIHCREALDETLEVMGALPKPVKGVMHSFGGTPQDVERIRRVAPDIYFGINGIVTFKNSRLRETLPAIGLDKLLLETDSPYLAPVPMRGRRNESAFIIHTAAHVADALGVNLDTLDAATSANARELFGIGA